MRVNYIDNYLEYLKPHLREKLRSHRGRVDDWKRKPMHMVATLDNLNSAALCEYGVTLI